MMQAKSQPELPPLIQRVVQRLIRAFAPERIMIFGSWAKGTTHDRSDVDILVIADLHGDPALYKRRAHQLAGNCFPPVDFVFATPAEVDGAATRKSLFLISILATGTIIYTRT
jgi:predicted nucleotidyltransferase